MGVVETVKNLVYRKEDSKDDEDNIEVANDPVPVYIEDEQQPVEPEGDK